MNPPGRTRPRVEFPPLVELAMSHYQFESIHPFNDGNGRLGRLLVNIAPSKAGLFRFPVTLISEYLESNRQEYYDRLLRVSTDGEWEEWTRFFLRALGEQARLGLALVHRLLDLRKRMLAAVATKRASALLPKLIDLLFIRQALSVRLVANELHITVPPAQRHIDRLVQLNILVEVTGRSYDRRYVARPVIRAMQGDPGPWPKATDML